MWKLYTIFFMFITNGEDLKIENDTLTTLALSSDNALEIALSEVEKIKNDRKIVCDETRIHVQFQDLNDMQEMLAGAKIVNGIPKQNSALSH